MRSRPVSCLGNGPRRRSVGFVRVGTAGRCDWWAPRGSVLPASRGRARFCLVGGHCQAYSTPIPCGRLQLVHRPAHFDGRRLAPARETRQRRITAGRACLRKTTTVQQSRKHDLSGDRCPPTTATSTGADARMLFAPRADDHWP